MSAQHLDAMLLTTEPEVRYFSGFHTQFWASPTRPWFLVVPLEGRPIAIIPEIGVAGMRRTWVEDIHSWPSPAPADDGVSLLKGVLQKTCTRHGRLGVPMGHESSLRMPLSDFQSLCRHLPKLEIADAGPTGKKVVRFLVSSRLIG